MKATSSHSLRPFASGALRLLLASLALAWLTGQTAAQDKKPADATGTWKWAMRTPNGQTFESRLRVKQDGEKLTGVEIGRGGNEISIQDGQVKDGLVSFKVIRDFGGNNFTSKYEGTLKGDAIEGKMETNRGGENQTRDWNARREAVKEKQPINVTGTWQWTFTTPGGQTFEPRARLNQSGGKLTGAVLWGETEMAISDAQVEDPQISFQVVRERDGRAVTTKYRGKLAGDSIQGKIESDWNGDIQTFDWSAKRVTAAN